MSICVVIIVEEKMRMSHIQLYDGKQIENPLYYINNNYL